MKLYATTTSERASKGQGGTKHVLTVFTAEINGQRQEIASMSLVNTEKDFYNFQYMLPDGTQDIIKVSKRQSEKRRYNSPAVKDDREQDAFNAGM